MSPRLRAALYAQAGAVFSLHLCLYAGDRPTAGRSRFATLLPGDAAVSPSNGDHAGTQRADPPPPRNGPKHRGAGRSRSATGPPRQSRSTRQFFCAEVLVGDGSGAPIREWNPWAYRVNPIAGSAVPVMLKKVVGKLGIKRLAVIYDQTQDGQVGDALVCKNMAKELGYELVAYEAFRAGDQDFSPQLA